VPITVQLPTQNQKTPIPPQPIRFHSQTQSNKLSDLHPHPHICVHNKTAGRLHEIYFQPVNDYRYAACLDPFAEQWLDLSVTLPDQAKSSFKWSFLGEKCKISSIHDFVLILALAISRHVFYFSPLLRFPSLNMSFNLNLQCAFT
jgi:hypothetical protein